MKCLSGTLLRDLSVGGTYYRNYLNSFPQKIGDRQSESERNRAEHDATGALDDWNVHLRSCAQCSAANV